MIADPRSESVQHTMITSQGIEERMVAGIPGIIGTHGPEIKRALPGFLLMLRR